MHLALYLKKPIITNGYYPKIDKKYIKEYKKGTLDQSLKIGNFFLNNINKECDVLVGPYEYDYWDSEKCKKITKWIKNNQELIKKACLEQPFQIIDDFCKQAIELDTGVEIDL